MNHPEEYHFGRMRQLVGNRVFKKVLDVGCGTGYLASFFRDCSDSILAVDKLESDIENAKKLYPEITFEQHDLEQYRIEGKYDLIIFSDVIYYLTQKTQERIMQEMHDALTDDGILLTSRHMANEDQEITHYPHLFERIDTERVQNIDTPSFWQVSLWRKTESSPATLLIPWEGELRCEEEVYQKITTILADKKNPFEVISALLWRALNDRKAIVRFLRHRLQQNNNTYSPEVLALLWLLNLEKANDSVWQRFQCSYHHAHGGDDKPDFRAEIFSNWIGVARDVLDVGIHSGIHTNIFAERNRVVGVDFPEIIKKFENDYRFVHCGINVEKEGLRLFADNSFDVVVMGEFLEHLQYPVTILCEASRVLKEGGILIGSCPYRTIGWEDPLHCQSVDEEKLKQWFEGLFIIEEIKIMRDKGTILFFARRGGD